MLIRWIMILAPCASLLLLFCSLLIDGHGGRGQEIKSAHTTAKTVIAVSPQPTVCKKLLRQPGVRRFFMPTWSLDELGSLRARMYESVALHTLQELFLKWGGVPRYVLEKAADAVVQQSLNAAVLSCSALERLDELVGQPDSGTDVSSKVLHYHVPVSVETGLHELTQASLVFASKHVADCVARLLLQRNAAGLAAFLLAGQGFCGLASLRGTLFERLAHICFSAAGISLFGGCRSRRQPRPAHHVATWPSLPTPASRGRPSILRWARAALRSIACWPMYQTSAACGPASTAARTRPISQRLTAFFACTTARCFFR